MKAAGAMCETRIAVETAREHSHSEKRARVKVHTKKFDDGEKR